MASSPKLHHLCLLSRHLQSHKISLHTSLCFWSSLLCYLALLVFTRKYYCQPPRIPCAVYIQSQTYSTLHKINGIQSIEPLSTLPSALLIQLKCLLFQGMEQPLSYTWVWVPHARWRGEGQVCSNNVQVLVPSHGVWKHTCGTWRVVHTFWKWIKITSGIKQFSTCSWSSSMGSVFETVLISLCHRDIFHTHS